MNVNNVYWVVFFTDSMSSKRLPAHNVLDWLDCNDSDDAEDFHDESDADGDWSGLPEKEEGLQM